MASFILKRSMSALIGLLGVISLVFFLIHMIPGDPIDVMLGESALAADREALRQNLGLHLPLYEQWWKYLTALTRGDFGYSLFSGRPITDLLLERIPATLHLSSIALIIAIIVALPLGLLAATRQHSLYDYGSMGFALVGM